MAISNHPSIALPPLFYHENTLHQRGQSFGSLLWERNPQDTGRHLLRVPGKRIEWKEIKLSARCSRGDFEVNLRVVRLPLQGKRGRTRFWEACPVFFKNRHVGGSGRFVADSNWQFQRQIGTTGHTAFCASQPGSVRWQGDLSRRQSGWRRHFHQDHHLVLISVGDHVSGFDMFEGYRPLQRPGLPPGRQVPFQIDWQPGIARIDPVRMPTRSQAQVESRCKRMPRLERGPVG